jgi:hypothetical protein
MFQKQIRKGFKKAWDRGIKCSSKVKDDETRKRPLKGTGASMGMVSIGVYICTCVYT